MGIMFRVASGREDFEAVANLWNRRYGRSPSALARFRMLIQTGSLVVTQDSESDRVVGAVPLDFLSFDNTLLVAFNLVPEDDDGTVLRQQIQLVLQATIRSAVGRVLLYADETEDYRGAIREEFNACLAEQRLPVSLEFAGTVEDNFRDDRDLPVSSLFIRRAERPDLNRQAPATVDARIRTTCDLSGSNLPEFLATAKRGNESKSVDSNGDGHKSSNKDTKDDLDTNNKDFRDKGDKDNADHVKDKEISDTDKNTKDSEDKADKEAHDKNEKDIHEVDKQASDKTQDDKDRSDKDPNEKDKEQSDKDPSDKDKEQSDKDPSDKDKEQSDKDPSDKDKEQSDKDDRDSENGGGGGGGGKEEERTRGIPARRARSSSSSVYPSRRLKLT